MKPSTVKTLSFLILAFAAQSQLGTSESEPVLDVYGNKVESNLEYYLVSALWGTRTGGGISTNYGKNGQCPTEVIQLSRDKKMGKSLRLVPYDNSSIVRESTNLELNFSVTCDKKPLWKVGDHGASLEKRFITIGEAKACGNWFRLEKVTALSMTINVPCLYQIVHCPSPTDLCGENNTVGVSEVDGVRRLSLPGDRLLPFDRPLPLPVVLFPAASSKRSKLFRAAYARSMLM